MAWLTDDVLGVFLIGSVFLGAAFVLALDRVLAWRGSPFEDEKLATRSFYESLLADRLGPE